jgi:hypothetical protein
LALWIVFTLVDEALAGGLEAALLVGCTDLALFGAGAVLRGGLMCALAVVLDAEAAVGRIMRARNPWSTSFSFFGG